MKLKNIKFLGALLLIYFTGLNSALSGNSKSELTELTGDRFILDLKYNTENNFLKRNVYKDLNLDKCYVAPVLFEKLKKLEPLLLKQKMKIVLWDCFRPIAIQEQMWKIVPDERYVANPKKGSNHNRGTAIDITLSDEMGNRFEMPTGFDDFSTKSASRYVCSNEQSMTCQNRDKLFTIMKSVGLSPIATEWWHFQTEDAGKHPVIKEMPHD